MAYGGGGWIGGQSLAAAPDGPSTYAAAVRRSIAEPSLVVSAAHSAFGVVRRLQVRVGDVPVLVHTHDTHTDDMHTDDMHTDDMHTDDMHTDDMHTDDMHTDDGGEPDFEVRTDLDLAAHLTARLDLAGREDEAAPPDRWRGTLAAARYHALRRADPGDDRAVRELARSTGCPAELVRAAAAPVSLSRVEVVRREGAGLPGGPTGVAVDELAWIDGGPAGLWTVRPGELDLDGVPSAVVVCRGSAAELAAELTRLVQVEEGC